MKRPYDYFANLLAHIIREPSRTFAKSVCALEAERRWGVSGTPIQNRLMDLFSLFKFLRCSPFDDLRVFNAQVTEKWRARSDPESIAKLKILVNSLSIRRPKDTIELLPRKDHISRLDFDAQEWKSYKIIRSKALSTMTTDDHGSRDYRNTNFSNTLKWINELRLICNHGARSLAEIETVEQQAPQWSAQQAQTCFDQLDAVGLAKCSDHACNQELSSVVSNEDTEHLDEPWVDKSLDVWCSQCFKRQSTGDLKAYRVCNHLPRISQTPCSFDEQDVVSDGLNPSHPSVQVTSARTGHLPSKLKKLIQDLSETPNDTKRWEFACIDP